MFTDSLMRYDPYIDTTRVLFNNKKTFKCHPEMSNEI